MDPFMYYNPTKLLFGKGQLGRLPKEVKGFGRKILLVYGGGSIKRSGLYDDLMTLLVDFDVFELADVEPNPRVDTVRKCVSICKEEDIDFILAVGWGSVIDCAKAISVGAKADVDVWDIICRKVRATDGIPYGSIVTIAGTGAEMSLISVITNWETNDKRSWVSSFSRAKFTIVDPTFMKTVPKMQTVYGIVDTMSHILEHYFHHAKNTPIQDEFLESVLRNLIEVTPKLLVDLNNDAYRETIAYASTIALSDQLNMGFTGDWGTHHIDHALSAVYDIPHGGGMAILFPNWMRQVLTESNVDRFKRLAINVFLVQSAGKTDIQIAEEGIQKLSNIWESWGAPTKLSEYDIPEKSLPLIAEKTLATEPNCGFFVRLTEQDVLEILQKSW